MSADINTDDLNNSLSDLAKKFGIIDKDLKDYEKNLKRGNKSYKDHLTQIDKLDDAIESLNENLDSIDAQAKRSLLMKKKIEVESAASGARLEEAITKTTSKITSTVIAGSSSFIRSMQTGASTATLSQNLLNSAVDITAAGAEAAGGGLQSFGAGAMSGGKKMQAVGIAASLVGSALTSLTPAVAGLAKFGIQFMTTELEKTTSAMKIMTSVGASFGDGLTGMRKQANASGLGLEDFSKIVSSTQETLHAVGITGGESTSLLSYGMAALTKTVKTVNGVQISTRDQLQNLGYSYEEQGSIMALYMQQQTIAGKNLAKIAPAELASGTAEYAKNLKVIADLTGKDAKKIMEKAQAETMRGALMQTLDTKQKAAFTSAFSAFEEFGAKSPAMQLALEQFIKSGMVNDASIAGNQQAMELIQKTAQGVMAGSNDMLSTTRSNMISAGREQEKFNHSLGDATDTAKMFGAGGTVVSDYADVSLALTKMSLASETAATASKTAAAAQFNTTDATTQNFTLATKAVNDFKVEMENLATTLMPKYTALMTASIATTAAMIKEAMRVAGGGKDNKSFDWAELAGAASGGAMAGGIAGGMGGTVALPLVGTVAGGTAGAVFGGVAGAGLDAWHQLAGKANGGISSGPISGYAEKLHGTEAVVPLPDGRSIPVTLDSSSITNSINQQNSILNSILDTLQKNNQLTSGILQQAY